MSPELLAQLAGILTSKSPRPVAFHLAISNLELPCDFSRLTNFAGSLMSDELAKEAVDELLDLDDVAVGDDGLLSVGENSRQLLDPRTKILAAASAHWDGDWTIYVANSDIGSAGLLGLDEHFARDRFGRLQQGCWLRPDNLPDIAESSLGMYAQGLHRMRARLPHPRSLVMRLWDLERWTIQATLVAALETQALNALRTSPEDALEDVAVVLCAAGSLLIEDPLLPPSLSPTAWPAVSLRSGFHKLDLALQAVTTEMLITGAAE